MTTPSRRRVDGVDVDGTPSRRRRARIKTRLDGDRRGPKRLKIKKETTHNMMRVRSTKRRHPKRTPRPHSQCARFHVFGAHVGLSGSSSSSSARSSSTSSPFTRSVQFGMMSLELKIIPYMPACESGYASRDLAISVLGEAQTRTRSPRDTLDRVERAAPRSDPNKPQIEAQLEVRHWSMPVTTKHKPARPIFQ